MYVCMYVCMFVCKVVTVAGTGPVSNQTKPRRWSLHLPSFTSTRGKTPKRGKQRRLSIYFYNCMGWRHGDAPAAVPNQAVAARPFAVPFDVSAREGRLWISFRGRHCATAYQSSCSWTGQQPERELLLKGVSWSGFQDPTTNCVEELGGFRYFTPITEYLSVLAHHHFNAVRLPLYARGVLENPPLNMNRCGHLSHDNNNSPVRTYMEGLQLVIKMLAANGQFVMLDMHSLTGTQNEPTWCGQAICTAQNEQYLQRAWAKLATAFCGESNVIFADIFNGARAQRTSLVGG